MFQLPKFDSVLEPMQKSGSVLEPMQKTGPTLSETVAQAQGGPRVDLRATRDALVQSHTKNYERMQAIRDKIYEGMRQKAMVQPQVPDPSQMGQEEAMRAMGYGMLARSLGARDQFVQQAAAQYIDTRQKQLEGQDQAAMVRGGLQADSARGLLDADIFREQGELGDLQSQNKAIEGELDQIYQQIQDELDFEQARELELLRQQGRITLDGVRTANKLKTDEAKRMGATDEEIRRIDEIAKARAYTFMQSGMDQASAEAAGYAVAWSEYDKKAADARKAGADATVAEGTVGSRIAQEDERARKLKLENDFLNRTLGDRVANESLQNELLRENIKNIGRKAALEFDKAVDAGNAWRARVKSGDYKAELSAWTAADKSMRASRDKLKKEADTLRKQLAKLQAERQGAVRASESGKRTEAQIQGEIDDITLKLDELGRSFNLLTEELKRHKMEQPNPPQYEPLGLGGTATLSGPIGR